MPFPKFPNKHLEEALFTAKDYAKYKKKGENFIPKKVVLFYQDYPLRYFKKKYPGGYETIKIHHNCNLLKIGNVGIIKVEGIGAPNAVTLLEELIAFGAKEFITFGIAGGLVEPGIFLCNKALRDEGTSHHYISDSLYAYPNKDLTDRLEQSLKNNKIDYQIGPTWTTDAPYMETKKEIEHYRKEGIKIVEMETSALFAVSQLRGTKIASVFVVSDILGKEWDPKFHKINMRKTVNKLLDISIDCFKGD